MTCYIIMFVLKTKPEAVDSHEKVFCFLAKNLFIILPLFPCLKRLNMMGHLSSLPAASTTTLNVKVSLPQSVHKVQWGINN